jgi:hypothetical protein
VSRTGFVKDERKYRVAAMLRDTSANAKAATADSPGLDRTLLSGRTR